MKKRIIFVIVAAVFLLLAIHFATTPPGTSYPEDSSVTCSDGFDNNLNGLIDCEDESCFGKEVCDEHR